MTHQICNKCKQDKPIDRFRHDASYKTGYRSTCKDCVNASRRVSGTTETKHACADGLGGVKPFLLLPPVEPGSTRTADGTAVVRPPSKKESPPTKPARPAGRRRESPKENETAAKISRVSEPPVKRILAPAAAARQATTFNVSINRRVEQQQEYDKMRAEANRKAILRLIEVHRAEFNKYVVDEQQRQGVVDTSQWAANS